MEAEAEAEAEAKAEAEAMPFKMVEAEAEAEAILFEMVEAEAEAEAVLFQKGLLEAEAEAVQKSTASASLVTRKLIIAEQRVRKTLLIIDVRATGLKLPITALEPPLCIGTMLAPSIEGEHLPHQVIFGKSPAELVPVQLHILSGNGSPPCQDQMPCLDLIPTLLLPPVQWRCTHL